VLEAAGLATVSLSQVREHTEKIRPPRAVFVPFPFGMPLGAPDDSAQQHRVIAAALDTFLAASGPVLVDVSDSEWEEAGAGSAIQASSVSGAGSRLDVATEVFTMRRAHEQWVAQQGRTSVGVSGVDPKRFRGVVRFLEAYAAGRDADMSERPDDIPLPVFVRRCVDDLKAMYMEGRLVERPGESADDRARWLWGETALGDLLRRVRDRVEASDPEKGKEMAWGIAR
jgi:hypothetical protein